MKNTNKKSLTRRNFLFQGGKSLITLACANVAVYALGTAFKELDGSLVAGAKCCHVRIDSFDVVGWPGGCTCVGTKSIALDFYAKMSAAACAAYGSGCDGVCYSNIGGCDSSAVGIVPDSNCP